LRGDLDFLSNYPILRIHQPTCDEMRVIGGSAKGRRLCKFKGEDIRPTPDMVREALFNIIREEIVDASFLDLFAGTGGVGIEALSMGAKVVFFVDNNLKAKRIIYNNLKLCGFLSSIVDIPKDSTFKRREIVSPDTPIPLRFRFIRDNAINAIHDLDVMGERFDLIFIDPPYKSDLYEPTLNLISQSSLLKEGGMVIVEHFFKRVLEDRYGILELTKRSMFGDTTLSFWR
jgi:16S rRNA (guanine(966)-N(2))-methyltransferase RsmD